jgi:lysozyme family protein
MTFEQCIGHILKWEGGLSDHPNDPGGLTKYGIAKKFYPHLDIANLTKDQAIEIYRKDYWHRNKLEEMPPKFRLAYFDCVVNQGPNAAAKILQRTVGVTVDGIIGPKTRTAMLIAGDDLTMRFLAGRMMHYVSLTNLWPDFGLGWTRRLIDTAIESGKQLRLLS